MKTKTQLTNRILSLVLTFVMVLGMLPMSSFTAFAADTKTEKNIMLGASHIEGAQASNVYFGNYYQSDKNGQRKDPIKWRVLSNEDGKLFLLSDQALDVFRYHEELEAVTWETSTMRSWLNGLANNKGNGENAIDYTNDNFLDTAFAASEQTAISDTPVVNNDNPTYGTDGGNNTTDKVFLLSIEEAQNTAYGFTDNTNSTDTRKATYTAYVADGGKIGSVISIGVDEAGYWLLRSPGYKSGYVARVIPNGTIYVSGINVDISTQTVRPAFNINLSSVLFTSAADGSAQTDFAQVKDYTGNEWKLTLKDGNSFANGASISKTTFCAGQTVTLNHRALSAISADYTNVTAAIFSGDTMLYYGSIGTDKSATSTTFTLPSDLAVGNYTLKFYGEDWNGAKKTDIATGTPYSVNITISNHTGGSATCIAKAKCSVCGEEYGDLSNTHSWGDWTTSNGRHIRTCTLDSSHTESGNCSGGMATCTEQAVCSLCKTAYGELGGHTLTYTANGNVITVTCSAECGYTGTATISATGKTYDGTALEASVAYSDSWASDNLTIAYAVKDGNALNEAPKNAGAYTASITIGGATVSVDFTIAKADPTYTVPTGFATYGQTLRQVTLTTPSGDTPGSWTWNDESTTSVGNAGSNKFKATFTPDDENYKTVEADITIVVAKATPIVTAPTAVSGLVYTGEALALVGAGSTTGGTLRYSLDNAAWSTEIPTAINAGDYTVYYKVVGGENYGDVAAQSINVTITDKTAPAGTILIKENGWNKFWNTITFGIFCKDYVDVTITADDTGSGVAKVEYLLSETAIDENNIPDDGWTTLTKDGDAYKFKIQPQNKVAVYVRITDEGGNVTVINSDGIVVYEDSEAVDTEVTYTYKETSNKDIAVEFNGNTVRSIACGEKVLAANTDYSVDYESGKIVLQAFYLDTLNAGNYTFTVSYNPMGVENSGVTDLTTTFTVKVEPASITGATVNVNGTFTYDGNAQTPDPVVVLNGETLVKDQDYTVSYNNNTKATNDGKATVIVTGKGNYIGTASASFEIGRAKLTDVSVQQNGKLTYDGGKALTPAVTANATALNGAEVLFMYSADGTSYGSMPTFTDAGTYTVHYCAYTTDNNFIDYYNTFTVTIDKATVNEPTIASKPFINAVQKADISDTDLYTVVKNNGGTAKGSYDVVLKLKDRANYKWSTTDNEEVTLQFVISTAQNSWDTKPSISDWTYGETAKTPVGAAKYGTVKVVYSGTANDGSAYNSETAPTKAGNYTATFTVEGTEDYSGLSEQVNFTITKKAITVTANDASKTYGDSDPTFTYTHTDLVGSDALVITVARASGENANTYTITASQAEGENPNYEITFKNGTFTIHKAALTVTVEDKTATYGDAVPNYTVKYDGFVNGDDKDDLGGTLAFACDYVQFSDKGEYTIKASGYTSGNYTINYVDGKLTVNAKPITVTIQNATSIYGEALAELKATDNGIVNNDKDVYSLATVATSTSNVGKYAITGTALDSNYAITFVNGEYEITKREITITVEAKNTVVNTALPTYTYKVEGLVGEDKLETEPTLTSNADISVIGEYDITATGADAGGNYSIKYVPAKLTVLTDNAVDAAAGYTEELKGYDPATVTSEDKAELDEILNEINTILEDENITDNGKKALEEVKEQVEKLIKEITDAADATDTENVGKVENITPENVTPENKTDLEGAKADFEKALEDHGSNMTDDEKKAVEDEIKRIDEALEVIGNVEAVEELIDKLPDTIKKDDEAAIKAADDAYNALSDYEKSLVGKDAKKALDDAKAALAELNKPADPNSPATGDNSNMFLWIALLFISGGALITLTVVDRKRRTALNK